MRRSLSWVVMAAVLVVALAVGSTSDRAPRTEGERVQALAAEVRCPTCQSLSAAESDAKAAQAIRDEIRTRVRRGESNEQIRSFLVSRFGDDVILKPRASGITGLVWALPVLGGLLAAAGLFVAFRRWRREAVATASAEDEALVARALRS